MKVRDNVTTFKKARKVKSKDKPKPFSITEYQKKEHVLTCDEITKDNRQKILDIANDFVKTVAEYEILRRGQLSSWSGKRDTDYGVVIANMDNADFIAPIVFKQNEDGLAFSQVVNRIYLYKTRNYLEASLEIIDISKSQCFMLGQTVEGLNMLIKEDVEKFDLSEWGL